MKSNRLSAIFGYLVLASAMSSVCLRVDAQSARNKEEREQFRPPLPRHGALSFPISLELVPLNPVKVGQTARFQVNVDSKLDPDLVREIRVEYELPASMRRSPNASTQAVTLQKSGRSQMELEVIVPDETRHSVRARLIVDLVNGKSISQTAVRWIDLGAEDPPEGLIGRIVDPAGNAIRVYQGITVGN